MLEYAIYEVKRLERTKPQHIEQDKKYSCFVREDVDAILDPRNRIIVYLMAPTLFPRYLFLWGIWAMLSLVCGTINSFHA